MIETIISKYPFLCLWLHSSVDVGVSVAIGFVLCVLLIHVDINAFSFERTERREFWSLPADDSGLRAWAADQTGIREVVVTRTEDTVAFRYQSVGFATAFARLSVPWADLGYGPTRMAVFSLEPRVPDVAHTIVLVILMNQVGFLITVFVRSYRSRRRGEPPGFFAGNARAALRAGALFGIAMLLFGGLHDTALRALVDVPSAAQGFWAGIREFGPAARGAIVSALVFAGVHLDPMNNVFYVLVGLLLAWLYHRTRSLLAPMLAHVINNAGALALMMAGYG